jgi:hypothetical protein
MPKPTRLARLFGVCAASMLGMSAAACGDDPSSPNGPDGPSLVQLTDLLGDASPQHDLVSGTAEVLNDRIAFTVRFAEATFNPLNSQLFIYIDTDSSRTTGAPIDNVMGMDYFANASLDASATQATVFRCPTSSAACPNVAGSAPATFLADGIRVTVPLSVLGNDDGKLRFRVYARMLVQIGEPDFMPDLTLAPARVD